MFPGRFSYVFFLDVLLLEPLDLGIIEVSATLYIDNANGTAVVINIRNINNFSIGVSAEKYHNIKTPITIGTI